MRAKQPYKKKRKRVGCGIGSGHGKTATRGQKGQRSRSGAKIRPGFEGGQNPLYRKTPKRGFNHTVFRRELATVNLESIEILGKSEITPEILKELGVVRKMKWGVKVLGDGNLTKAVTVKAHRFSASAKEKIEKAGGQAIVIEEPVVS